MQIRDLESEHFTGAHSLGPSALEAARVSLATGRHAHALLRLEEFERESPFEEADAACLKSVALLGLLRHGEAIEVANLALARGSGEVAARLRVCKGHGLWLIGDLTAARAELQRSARDARHVLTRARAEELLGLGAWKAGDVADATARLARAETVYSQQTYWPGLTEVMEKKAGLLCDEGRFEEALETHGRRLNLARSTTRSDLVAKAHCDRGEVLVRLGRWEEARRELDRGAELFRAVLDPREAVFVARHRAMIELATGNLAAVRDAALKLKQTTGIDRSNPRLLGEHYLLEADAALAGGEYGTAVVQGGEALALFGAVEDREGQCRARVRRAHAFVGAGHFEDAEREARRALELQVPRGSVLPRLAELARGRAALQRGNNPTARAAFARAAGANLDALSHAAALGAALAGGAGRGNATVQASLEALERSGERRYIGFCLEDIRRLEPEAGWAGGTVVEAQLPPACPRSEIVMQGALPFSSPEPSFPLAVSRVQTALGWRRAAWITAEPTRDWLLDGPGASPRLLPANDLARRVASGVSSASVVRLHDEGSLDPVTRFLGLTHCLVLPAARGALCLDYGSEREVPATSVIAGALDLVGLWSDADTHQPPCPEPGARADAWRGMIGESAAFKVVLQQADSFSRSDWPIFLFGETGTGKEGFARALHALSGRPGPFVPVNTAELTDELFASRMFGHRRGAFSGAVEDSPGFVSAADGGTLFLDEVADLGPGSQGAVLRFLESGEYRRVGETQLRRAEVRVVSATNVKLSEAVAEKRFRADLLFRLTVLQIDLPPLRERANDVLLLARHFLRQTSRLLRLGTDAEALLTRYQWPGNVRELRAVIGRASLLAAGGPIRAEHLSEQLQVSRSTPRGSLHTAMTAVRRKLIEDVLCEKQGNRTLSAAQLGISRQALHNHIKRYGLN
jgi:transcriptional regulator with AAA-type ATPase domain/tetratricopeptide (TPR) repeat protein